MTARFFLLLAGTGLLTAPVLLAASVAIDHPAPFLSGADASSEWTGPAAAARRATVSAAVVGTQRFVIVPEDSQVIYRVVETLFREGNRLNTAVGLTRAVRGETVINRSDPRQSTIGPITVDISQFRSDSARRDQAIRERWLESARFPTARFTARGIQGLPATYQDGQELRLQVSGDLTVRDVTRPATFEVSVTLNGPRLAGFATTTIRMTDFGFEPPSLLGILRTENEVKIEFTFAARAQ